VKFYEKPYVKLAEPKIKRLKDGKAEITMGLSRYVLFDFPVEDEEERAKLRKLAKDNFAVFIDYWAIDWDYDGFTFKSLWQDIRGNGRKTKVVCTSKTETLEASGKRTIAGRVVDVFGNDATATVEVDLR
jgi:adenine-specific DNA-methyltransferase